MYEEDHRFKRLEQRDAKIWRYMNLHRYEDLLRSGTLYFCIGEKYREDDPYEGSYLSFELLQKAPPDVAKRFAEQMKSCGPPVTVNCWHMNEFESIAMWKLYGKEVAIQSSFQRLADALSVCPCNVKIGMVDYIVPGEESFKSDSTCVFVPWLHKHRGFEYERELRAIIWETPGDMPREGNGSVRAPVNLEALIEAVYVAPKADPDVKARIQETNKACGITVPVHQSELRQPPPY